MIFVTSNDHKSAQAKAILSEFGIRFRRIKRKYDEASEDTIEQIACKAAKRLADEYKEAVFVEDTGVFFDAYPGFPGSLPKFLFNGVGYDGIFRLLVGKSRKAVWRSAVGYCEPGKEPRLFTGEMRGKITDQVKCKGKNVLPYERIFIHEKHRDVLAMQPQKEKLAVLHRAQALRKLGRFLKSR